MFVTLLFCCQIYQQLVLAQTSFVNIKSGFTKDAQWKGIDGYIVELPF